MFVSHLLLSWNSATVVFKHIKVGPERNVEELHLLPPHKVIPKIEKFCEKKAEKTATEIMQQRKIAKLGTKTAKQRNPGCVDLQDLRKTAFFVAK